MKEAVFIVLVMSLSIGMAFGQFSCEVKGRFLDNLSNCTSFYECKVDSNNKLQMTRMQCPFKELFSVEEQRCVLASNLMCRLMTDGTTTSMPILIDTTTTPSPPTSKPNGTNSSSLNADDEFRCPAVGRFPSPNPGCRKYFDCQLQFRNILLNVETCPQMTVFDPKQASCVPESAYNCPTRDLVDDSEVINTTSVTEFNCTARGRFAVKEPGCKHYILCTLDSLENLVPHIYECKSGVFSEPEKSCVLNRSYVCPYISESTMPIPSSQTSFIQIGDSSSKHEAALNGSKEVPSKPISSSPNLGKDNNQTLTTTNSSAPNSNINFEESNIDAPVPTSSISVSHTNSTILPTAINTVDYQKPSLDKGNVTIIDEKFPLPLQPESNNSINSLNNTVYTNTTSLDQVTSNSSIISSAALPINGNTTDETQTIYANHTIINSATNHTGAIPTSTNKTEETDNPSSGPNTNKSPVDILPETLDPVASKSGQSSNITNSSITSIPTHEHKLEAHETTGHETNSSHPAIEPISQSPNVVNNSTETLPSLPDKSERKSTNTHSTTGVNLPAELDPVSNKLNVNEIPANNSETQKPTSLYPTSNSSNIISNNIHPTSGNNTETTQLSPKVTSSGNSSSSDHLISKNKTENTIKDQFPDSINTDKHVDTKLNNNNSSNSENIINGNRTETPVTSDGKTLEVLDPVSKPVFNNVNPGNDVEASKPSSLNPSSNSSVANSNIATSTKANETDPIKTDGLKPSVPNTGIKETQTNEPKIPESLVPVSSHPELNHSNTMSSNKTELTQSTVLDPNSSSKVNGTLVIPNDGSSTKETHTSVIDPSSNKSVPISSAIDKSVENGIIPNSFKNSTEPPKQGINNISGPNMNVNPNATPSSNITGLPPHDIKPINNDTKCPDDGIYAVKEPGCNRFYMCHATNDGRFVHKIIDCDENKVFSEAESSCVYDPGFECPYGVKKPIPVPDAGLECPSEGVFPVAEEGCKRFMTCQAQSNGELFKEVHTCGENEVFTGSVLFCVNDPEFVCPYKGDRTEPDSTTVDVDTTTDSTAMVTANLPQLGLLQKGCASENSEKFTCPHTGRFADVDSVDCGSYFLCLKSPSSNELLFAKVNCELGTIFNARQSTCENASNTVCGE